MGPLSAVGRVFAVASRILRITQKKTLERQNCMQCNFFSILHECSAYKFRFFKMASMYSLVSIGCRLNDSGLDPIAIFRVAPY